MTPQQALQILDQATSQIQASRQMHAQLAEALRVLQMVVNQIQTPQHLLAGTKIKAAPTENS